MAAEEFSAADAGCMISTQEHGVLSRVCVDQSLLMAGIEQCWLQCTLFDEEVAHGFPEALAGFWKLQAVD